MLDRELKAALIDIMDAGNDGWLTGAAEDPDRQGEAAAQAMLEVLRRHAAILLPEMQ